MWNSLHVIPRQRAVICLAFLFVFKDFVEAWNIPRKKTVLTLPDDYPLEIPFYRVTAIPDILKDLEELSTAEFSVESVTSSSKKKHVAIAVDSRNGTLSLTPKDLEAKASGTSKKQQQISATIAVGGNANLGTAGSAEVVVLFSGAMQSFCEAGQSICFPTSEVHYEILEGDAATGLPFDHLLHPGIKELCPILDVRYSLLSESDFVTVNSSSGILRLKSPLDAEKTNNFSFGIQCSVDGRPFSSTATVTVVDVDDNPLTTLNGLSFAPVRRNVTVADSSLEFFLAVVDKDSKAVNDLRVTIENDSLSLFSAKIATTFENIDKDNHVLYSAIIKSKKPFAFPGEKYKFTVVFEDVAYIIQNNNKVKYQVTVYNTSVESNLPSEVTLKDVYEVNISRHAARYARVLHLTDLKTYHGGMQFQTDVQDAQDLIGITKQYGIVYIKDPSLLYNSSSTTIYRNITWTFSKRGITKTGSLLLIMQLDDTGNQSKDCDSKWCALHGSERHCEHRCGRGAPGGRCRWRQAVPGTSGPRSDYATCSPDLSVCPDGRCDELERSDGRLCPQDCAESYQGEVWVSRSGRLQKAVGPCACPVPTRCTCVRRPAADHRAAAAAQSGHPPPHLPPENLTLLLAGPDQVDPTTTDVALLPISDLQDAPCGAACIAMLVVIPCVLLLLLVSGLLVWKAREGRRTLHKFVGSRISLSAVPSDYVEESSDSRTLFQEESSGVKTASDAQWEFPRSNLQIQTVLGEGEFGKVVKAQALNIAGQKGYSTVAVKMLKENGGPSEQQDLMSEFHLLKEVSHSNVVRLLGACTEKSGPLYLIVEFAEMGSLRNYLRKRRRHNACLAGCAPTTQAGCTSTAQPPTAQVSGREYYQFPCQRSLAEPHHNFFHKEQLSFAWQIAKGMAYLADIKLVHRDLAARNILLAKRKVAKISDFGLSRDVYEGDTYLKRSKGRVPVKWMAIESLEDNIYTSRSDVWSFGIVLWEIMMQGSSPYPGVTPHRLYNLLKAGYRMSQPDFCTDEMYRIMRLCWRDLPCDRPSFKELVQKLDFLLQDTVEYMDFDSCGSYSSHSRNQTAFPSTSTGVTEEFPTVQYTSVLLEKDEDDATMEESSERVGLVNLFKADDESAEN